jgi:CRP-like cAMP-binding protein
MSKNILCACKFAKKGQLNPWIGFGLRYRNRLLSALTSADAAALAPSMTQITLARGQAVFQPEDAVETVYFPSNAVLSVTTVMSDGREAETASIGYENAVGLLSALAESAAPSRVFARSPAVRSGFRLPPCAPARPPVHT